MPAEGAIWKQPVLAGTLRRLAEHGADDFYRGEIAREIANDMAANGGWITLDDLRNFPEPTVLQPLTSTYRDWIVYSLPPPGGGWVVLQILNLLEQTSAQELRPGTATCALKLIDALRIAHTSRRTKPVEDLVHFDDAVSDRISKETARRLLQKTGRESSGETTHFSVVDAEGMVVGVTASINAYYGAKVASPSLGFLYNDYMNEFEIDSPGHPFAIRPNAMPYSSMSPTILAKDGIPHLVIGSPGSSRIISSVAQVIQLWVDSGFGIADAVSAFRLHVHPTTEEIRLYVEDPEMAKKMHLKYEQRDYVLMQPGNDLANGNWNPYFGGIHAIAKKHGQWHGAADPRRDGKVMYANK
ncbi:MAG: gamma-glutamyltransferase [bacterium]